MLFSSDLADEEGLEGAGGVVPPEALAVPVPELEAVLLLPVLVLEVVRLPRVPVLVRHRLPRRHPEESEKSIDSCNCSNVSTVFIHISIYNVYKTIYIASLVFPGMI